MGARPPSTPMHWEAFRATLDELFMIEQELVNSQVRLLERINRYRNPSEKSKALSGPGDNDDYKDMVKELAELVEDLNSVHSQKGSG